MHRNEAEYPCPEAWIWPENDGIRWWTPSYTTLLRVNGPFASGEQASVRELRDRHDRLSLRHGLSPSFGHLLADALADRRRLRLHLSRKLDPVWHSCPYEWFTSDGESLFGSLLAERYAPERTVSVAPVDPTRPIAILNLLDVDEPVQPADAVPVGTARIYDGLAAVDHFLNQADVAGLGALVVVAHGTERGGDCPFRLPDGSVWGLPFSRGLPPLVILLACGNDEGNLVVNARRLLDAGAVTVLAPLGRPSPDGASRFLAEFLMQWRAGNRVDDALLAAQREPQAQRGACLLQLIGLGDLRMSTEVRREERADQPLAAIADGGDALALTTLINRLTLRCFQQGQGLDQAEDALRVLLNVRWYDEHAEKRLFSLFGRLCGDLWPMSQAWIRPLEALFAEAYDHRRLPEFEQARRELDRTDLVMPAPVYHYWSKIYYRQGRYALSLQDVSRGLVQIDPGAFCTQGAGLVGHLVGLLVDVDLPAPAEVLHQQMDDCLAQQADEKSAWERHKLKDRAARIALRLGQAERAMTIYRLKRRESLRFGGNGSRELAWLLYIGAWTDPQNATGLALGVSAILADEAAVRQGLGPGNVDPVYLLRAYAAWAWRAGSADACRQILAYRELLEERLLSGDAGPPGFVFAFLHLCRQKGMHMHEDIPSWDSIAAALENQRYFLELTALSALAGYTDRVEVLLRRLQSQRLPSSPPTFPAWLGDGILSDWVGLVAERTGHEQDLLVTGSTVTPERLVSSGLMPL